MTRIPFDNEHSVWYVPKVRWWRRTGSRLTRWAPRPRVTITDERQAVKDLVIRLAWRLLYRLSDEYEWVVYIDNHPRMTYAGWVDNPGEILDLWIGAVPNSKVHMERRLKSPVQVKLA